MVDRLILFLPSVFHFSIASFDVALMVHYRGILPTCPDPLRGWIYGQFIIHFWAGLISANRAFQRGSPSEGALQSSSESICLLFIFVWLVYALVIGYQTKECAGSYPVLYSTVVVGAVILGVKASRNCKPSSRHSQALLSFPVIPSSVSYQMVKDDALNDTCSFCMEEFGSTDRVVLLPCNHVYHPRVIREWIRTSQNCPLCRKSVEIR